MKKASGSKKEIKKEATSSRSRRNKQPKETPKETTKQVIEISYSDEIDSNYAEFLRTYDPEEEYSDPEIHRAILDSLSDASSAEKPKVPKKEESEVESDVESK
ncbi:hypothetical protein QL285_058766 [Trifolium repens]|nr:hypothetical protein QL285_058766 [Trifolium repens]